MRLFKKKDNENDKVFLRIVRQSGEKGYYYDVQERCQFGWYVEENFWTLEEAIEYYKAYCKSRHINYEASENRIDGRNQYNIIYCE